MKNYFKKKGNTTKTLKKLTFITIIAILLFVFGWINGPFTPLDRSSIAIAAVGSGEDLSLKDVLMLTRGIKIVPGWVPERAGQCISTLSDELNADTTMQRTKELVNSGKLHVIFKDRFGGVWFPHQYLLGIEVDSWHIDDANARMQILLNIIDKAIPKEQDITVEWWDECGQFRLYFHPLPFNDLGILSDMLKRLQTVKLKN